MMLITGWKRTSVNWQLVAQIVEKREKVHGLAYAPTPTPQGYTASQIKAKLYNLDSICTAQITALIPHKKNK